MDYSREHHEATRKSASVSATALRLHRTSVPRMELEAVEELVELFESEAESESKAEKESH